MQSIGFGIIFVIVISKDSSLDGSKPYKDISLILFAWKENSLLDWMVANMRINTFMTRFVPKNFKQKGFGFYAFGIIMYSQT